MIILEIVTYFLLGGLITLILREIREHYKHRKGKEVRKIQSLLVVDDAEQQIEDVISDVINTEITYFIPLREDKEDFLPKKRMKTHKIDQGIRKETFVSPGVHIRETDYSVMELPREQHNDLIG